MAVSSYKDGMKSSGDVEILKDLSKPIREKHVIIVEDIVDTGLTLTRLIEILDSRGAASIKIASFLDKPEPRIKKELKIDYTGFVIENEFRGGIRAGRSRTVSQPAVYCDCKKSRRSCETPSRRLGKAFW